MSLLYPSFLWLLVPLAALLFTQKGKKLTDIVHIAVLVLIVLALSRPVIREGITKSVIEAQDVIIAMDVSYSMQAKDIAPSRYDFAKKTIEAFLAQNPKDNIMLIAFTTNPLLLSPPTTDHILINTALKSLKPEYILTKGTSLKKLFAKVAALKKEEKNLLLITDGGEDESFSELSRQISDTNIHLTVLALGTKRGTTIENPDGTLLKDKKNNLVVSRINPMLEKLVSQTKGSYIFPASSAEETAEDLQSALDMYAQHSQEIRKKQQQHTELYQIPLFLALLLFIMLHTRAVRYLIPLFALLGIHAQASMMDGYYLSTAYSAYAQKDFNKSKVQLQKIDEPSLQSQFALANTYYRLKKYKKAIALYRSIRSSSARTKQKLYYNIANAYAMLEAYDKARIYYTKALQLGEDEASLHNLSVIALLKNKKEAPLGIAHPKSQNADAGKSDSQEKEDKEGRDEDQPSSGSGSGGEHKKEQQNKEEKKRLKLDEKAEEQPLSSKVYELINKGYIRETQPW